MATRRYVRSRADGTPVPQGAEPLGKVRRSQLVSTYGIGAIIDLDKGSFMPMGLEEWESATGAPSLTITEARLQAQLGVDHFRLPPVMKPVPGTVLVEAKPTLPAVRFPEWHECPKCHRIGKEGNPFELATDQSRLTCIQCRTFTTPVRFVVACRNGHIDEFPWEWWAHRNRAQGICDNPSLELRSLGRSASLGDLYVSCRHCRERSTLGDAFRPDALEQTCSAYQPWLNHHSSSCSARVRVLQRGASNVHFAVAASALSIPPVSDSVFQVIDESWISLGALPAEAVETVIRHIAGQYGVPYEALLAAYRERKQIADPTRVYTDNSSRADEYAALSQDRNDDIVGGFIPQFCNSVSLPPPPLDRWFDLVAGVSRLREVRALAGFSRIEPYPVAGERIVQALAEGKIARLSRGRPNWLPASEIRGEGLFLRLRTEAIDRWVQDNPAIGMRVAALEAASAAVADARGYERDYTITARLLLVHTFAHALIRQISVDCGYSSSALRERLYIADATGEASAMNGVLIYTGSPDSEGSLGGLVRLADPQILPNIVMQAIRNAHWCGSDPVCLETDPAQSGEKVSGAACHCCVLVPETACEKFNRELDRTMLTGDAEHRWKGYFHGMDE